jgi:DNA-binding response OmpR family regulator
MPGKKILIVDDDQDLVKLLARKLTQANFEALVAFDASQAMSLARKETPNLILLDMKLPAGGGLGTLQNLKNSMKTSMIPVIIITGQDTVPTQREVQNYGVEHIMTKPLDMEALIQKIKELLGEETKPAS